MSELENRLRRAGQQDTATGIGPDLNAIAGRGTARRRNKRIGAGIGAAAIIAVGAVGLGSRLDAPNRIETAADGISSAANEPVDRATTTEVPEEVDEYGDSAGAAEVDTTVDVTEADEAGLGDLLFAAGYDGQICFSYEDDTGAGSVTFTIDGDSGRVIVSETRTRGGANDPANVFDYDGIADDTGTRLDTTGLFIGEGDPEPSTADRVFFIASDLSLARNEGYDYPIVGCPEPATVETERASEVDDGLGGVLTVEGDELVHRRADGAEVVIVLPAPDSGAAQRWVTDIAPIDGVPYLFVDQFVNRDPVDTEVDFEVSILAINLATDEVVVVEQRRITEAASTDWIYNGHITTDGTNVVVMRELWQSYCLYAEGLTIDGQPIDVSQAELFPEPEGLDSLTEADIQRIQSTPPSQGAISPCLTLDDIPDDGVAALGRQADPDQFAAFAEAFYQSGLG